MRLILLVGVAGSWAGCDEFTTPAELAKPQILAIRADPPAILPGDTSALSILVADQDGAVTDPEVAWEAVSAAPGEPALGVVEVGQDGEVLYTAPGTISGPMVSESVSATVTSTAGALVGIKAITIGEQTFSNPELVALTADGMDVLASQTLALSPGQTVSLAADIGADMNDTTIFAWYTTIGTIDLYLSNPTELVAREEPGSGWLFAVVRDGRGGVVWQAIEVTVE